jgi:hypothetical protein
MIYKGRVNADTLKDGKVSTLKEFSEPLKLKFAKKVYKLQID